MVGKIQLVSLFTLCAFCSCKTSKRVATEQAISPPPKAAREFRAAWVATVSNINWPSKPGLSTAE